MKSPQLTGISSITGKTVYIRHATGWDLIMIQKYLKGQHQEERDLTRHDIVVAAEEDRIIGFGILGKARGDDAGCITITEVGKRHGIGESIVRHLMEYAPMKTIYVETGEPRYFTKLGFKKIRKSRNRAEAASSVCGWGERKSPVAAFEKR